MVLIAKIKAKSGEEKKMEKALLDMVSKVEQEEGTLMYTLHRSQNDPTLFMFYEKYTDKDLFNPRINAMIAFWYMNIRIPQLLRYYNKPITDRNKIICWDAGISYMVENKPLPLETQNFLGLYIEKCNR